MFVLQVAKKAMFSTLECKEEKTLDTNCWSKRLRVVVPNRSSWLDHSGKLYLSAELLQLHCQNSIPVGGDLKDLEHHLPWDTNPNRRQYVWHEVRVFRLRDVVTHELNYVVA